MSAEVPKLHRRLSLGDPVGCGDRPPAEVLVVLPEPVAPLPPRSRSSTGAELPISDRSMAFHAVHRFEYV